MTKTRYLPAALAVFGLMAAIGAAVSPWSTPIDPFDLALVICSFGFGYLMGCRAE